MVISLTFVLALFLPSTPSDDASSPPAPVPQLDRIDDGGQAPAAQVDLSGHWRFNPDKSEDARQKMHEAMQGRGGRGGFPGGGGRGRVRFPGAGGRTGGDPREGMRAMMEAPPSLQVTQTPSEITVLEEDGRLRALHPDGKGYKAEGGASEVKTRWEGAKLVVESRDERGARVTETFSTSADRKQLEVILKLEPARLPAITVRRVYDSAEKTP
jgi:hypothetical protein